MIPKRVTLENFLSFGTPATAIEFAADEPLWVLGGPNGVGKSAVFDAMTFCLYGAHRGGQKEIDPLVRHGANGFSVSFEFEFAGVDYRVSRNRLKKSTATVEQKIDGEWTRVPNRNSIADVTKWSEETLGVNFEAFKASVLLRQGEADAIIMAGGTDRLKILKKIIGAERYEELSGRVHEATRAKQSERDRLSEQMAQVAEVSQDERAAAAFALEEADAARATAAAAAESAAARIELAKQWVGLEAKRDELERKLAAAERRTANAADIRVRHNRLVELESVLPALKELVCLRDSLAIATAAMLELQAVHDRHSEQLQASTTAVAEARDLAEQQRADVALIAEAIRALEKQLEDDKRDLVTAEEVARVDGLLAELPADLEAFLAATEAAVRDAELDSTTAASKRSAAEALLKQRETQLRDFGSVEIGAKCSRCNQPVSAEHAERERRAMTDDIERLRVEVTAATALAKGEAERVRAARAEHTKFQAAYNSRARLTEKRLALVRHGEVPSATLLRDRIVSTEPELALQRGRHKSGHATLAATLATIKTNEAEWQNAEREVKTAAEKLQAARRDRDNREARRSALAGTLPGDWRSRWQALDERDVAAVEEDAKTLGISGVRTEYRQLQDDEARRDEWLQQRSETLAAIEAIPAESRVTQIAATTDAAAARQAAQDATTAWDVARRTFDDQTTRIERRSLLREALSHADKAASVHTRLDDLLGKKGLQLCLVNDAQKEIVRLANRTLGTLSNGDLTIELDSEVIEEQAFALQVRRADDPTPIGVAYLSGSQKFRVAVAVALAIGQYCNTSATSRPLESVIIDEGFGSLDRDGLDAMHQELARLGEHLKRIILVSHQEEFANRFPVVIKLSRGETGTIAERVRQ